MKQYWLFILAIILSISSIKSNDSIPEEIKKENLVYVFEMKDMIGPGIWRQTQKAFEEADSLKADYIIVDMNTYGGLLDAADSIRTKILNSKKPVYVFINNNAASAGALISIACDSIYMRTGANIGAATVVNQTGEQMPDKYQAYMRSLMRATAESHGKDTLINGSDTVLKWKRDPLIAEAMVDSRTIVEGLVDSSRVLSFTTEEAIKYGFCEGKAESITEVLEQAGIENYEIKNFELTSLEKMIGWLVNPVFSGILIMIIVGGIYFELQSPGIGFPLAASIIAATLYFAPLYLEGLAENWEIIVFIVGIILIGVEVFAIPGFGVAGVAGIIMTVTGLTLSMIDNIIFEFEFTTSSEYLFRSLLVVVISMIVSIVASIYFSKKLLLDSPFNFLVLNTTEDTNEGYVGIDAKQATLTGKTGTAMTILRPSGKVMIDNEIIDAKCEIGYIDKGESIKVIRHEATQVYVIKNEE
jgi:membrane-bound serine protease (ClpP class)